MSLVDDIGGAEWLVEQLVKWHEGQHRAKQTLASLHSASDAARELLRRAFFVMYRDMAAKAVDSDLLEEIQDWFTANGDDVFASVDSNTKDAT